MIICNCNALNTSQVAQAIDMGARTLEEVFSHHGTEQLCGQCSGEIMESLIRKRTELALQEREARATAG